MNGQAPVRIAATAGRTTTIVGSNGAGKSALGLWIDQNSGDFSRVRRLIAHRRLWFQHAGPEISPALRESTDKNLISWRRENESRYSAVSSTATGGQTKRNLRYTLAESWHCP